jgi:hypothetical protein
VNHKQEILEWYCSRKYMGSSCDKCRENNAYCNGYMDLSTMINRLIDSCPKGCKIVGQAEHEPDCNSPDIEAWKKREKEG